ncbi:MAG: pyruvate dehydrogenase (acetyl-transferring) E1 component subunit alpha [Burkholderiales bacterium]|nr:pyruvate dehydrogenase (acetyl-transferring) E1 component subunit alpha [Phycisphaerae bacterium]
MAVADVAVAPSKSVSSSDGQVERQRLRTMLLIRRFEERTYQEYTKPGQKIGGFCHLYSGQEAISVGLAALFDKKRDYLINGYRCHGHSLALGMDPRLGFAELFGKATGCSKGKGGSMHFFDASVGNMGGHGIVGGQLPLGTGFAFAQKYNKTGGFTVCLFGDGAVNQGTHNESLNLASLWKLPIIFMVENNGVAMGTEVHRHSAETDLAKRGLGYNMPTMNVDGNDIDVFITEIGRAVDRARRGEGPTYVSANTFRFRGHSMSDSMATYRTKEQQDAARSRDPIALYSDRLIKKSLLTSEQLEAMEEEAGEIIVKAVEQAEADPHPALEDRFNDILAETYPYQPK